MAALCEKNMNLYEQLNSVEEEESLMKFVEALVKDLDDELQKEKIKPSSPYGPGANGWENIKLSDFLWAATSWAESSKNGLPMYEKSDNPWKRIADILYAAKIYE